MEKIIESRIEFCNFKTSNALLLVQRKASRVLMGLLHCWQGIVGNVITAVKRCPFEALFSLSLASRSRSLFLSFSFSCKIQAKRWMSKSECRCVMYSAFRQSELCILDSITHPSIHQSTYHTHMYLSIYSSIHPSTHSHTHQYTSINVSTHLYTINPSTDIPIYPSIYTSFHLPTPYHPSTIYIFFYPSINLPIYHHIVPSIDKSIHLATPTIHPPIYKCIYPSIHPAILSTHLLIHLPIFPSTYPLTIHLTTYRCNYPSIHLFYSSVYHHLSTQLPIICPSSHQVCCPFSSFLWHLAWSVKTTVCSFHYSDVL